MLKLYKIHNQVTGEVFTLFATSKTGAVSCCPLDPGDTFTIDEVMATLPDGSQHNIHMLKDIPHDSYFRTVNYNSLKVGKTVWLKESDSYDRSTRKYCCIAAEDICKSREFKPTQWVITTFTY